MSSATAAQGHASTICSALHSDPPVLDELVAANKGRMRKV
eukprot:SAG31_NODE_34841_length_328_cov_1.493450_2_plen_39_part_01